MAHSRTASLSEFIHFLFKTQLFDHTTLKIEQEHPELKGQTGMQLKTFRESSTPVDDDDVLFDEDEDQFLGASFSSDMSFSMSRPRPQSQHAGAGAGGADAGRAGRGHTRRTSSIFDTSRFSAPSSASSDRTSFVSSPSSTTPSSPTMSSSGHGWRLYGQGYGGQTTTIATGRSSTESTRTSSTS